MFQDIHTSARTLRQDKVDVLIRKQCYNLKLRIEVYHKSVIESIFESCSFKAPKLFAKWRDNIEVTRL